MHAHYIEPTRFTRPAVLDVTDLHRASMDLRLTSATVTARLPQGQRHDAVT
jgi:hypothetical protein